MELSFFYSTYSCLSNNMPINPQHILKPRCSRKTFFHSLYLINLRFTREYFNTNSHSSEILQWHRVVKVALRATWEAQIWKEKLKIIYQVICLVEIDIKTLNWKHIEWNPYIWYFKVLPVKITNHHLFNLTSSETACSPLHETLFILCLL